MTWPVLSLVIALSVAATGQAAGRIVASPVGEATFTPTGASTTVKVEDFAGSVQSRATSLETRASSLEAREVTLFSWAFNSAGTGNCPTSGSGCAGHKLPARAFTVSGISTYLYVAATTSGGTVDFLLTDGTNNCTISFACTGNVDSTGAKRSSSTSGTCAFPANAALVLKLSSSGCTGSPTFRNLDVVGTWQ